MLIIQIFLRNLWLGNLIVISDKIDKKVILLSTIVSSIALTVIFAINNYRLYGNKYTGILDFHFWIAILIIFVQMFIICLGSFYFIGKREVKKNNIQNEK